MNKEIPIKEFSELVEIVRRLRNDCPWDRIQTHLSLRRCLLEETYEVLEAIDSGNKEELRKELGDLLLQVVFHANIAEEEEQFTLGEVISGESRKLVDRHPHVFGGLNVSGAEEVKRNWEKLKRNEGRKSVIDGIPEELPALLKAYRIQEKASKVGFDWNDSEPAFSKILEELNELKSNLEAGCEEKDIEDELGDLLFSIVNYSRFLKINPEDALRGTINKFRSRFSKIEKFADDNGKNLEEMSLDEMDEIWNKSK